MMKIHSNLVFAFDFIPLIISRLFPVNRINIVRANIWIGRGHFYEAMCQSITAFHRDLLMCQEKIDMWKILKFGVEFLGLKYQFDITSELDSNASRESRCFARIQGKKNPEKKNYEHKRVQCLALDPWQPHFYWTSHNFFPYFSMN